MIQFISSKKHLIVYITLLWTMAVEAQEHSTDSIIGTDTIAIDSDATSSVKSVAHPWNALGEVILANGLIYAADRYVINFDFSKNTINTIKRNFKSGFIWDDDEFLMNYAGHSYQGSIFFNAARSNGLSFWQSVPYTTIGSLTWEFLCETEEPSINDVIGTTFAGSLMGEVFNKISHIVIDERETGAKRVARETTAALLNPIEGLHRMLTGHLWKVRRDDKTATNITSNEEVHSSVTVCDRYVSALGQSSHGRHQPFIAFAMDYGVIDGEERHFAPYDFFSFDLALAFGKDQHPISNINIMGRLCSMPAFVGKEMHGEVGLYQFFNYEDTNVPVRTQQTPFPYGEMASLGPGMMFALPNLAPRLTFEQRFFTKGVLLGAIKSDYYKYNKRDYNMGSGYGAASLSRMTWKGVGSVQLKAQYMHLYTWKGYEPREISELTYDGECLNVLGDKSNARLLSFNIQMRGCLSHHLAIAFGTSYVTRHTHYKYHPSHHAKSYELKAGMEWTF